MGFEESLAGGGLVAAVVGLIWALKKMMNRSSCQGHSGCCDIQIDRVKEELERTRTERDNVMRLLELVGGIKKRAPDEEPSETVELKVEEKKGETLV